ncbi:MAG: AraC family transcriptional regulator [Clostridia bacterium]|nr:AraC family transcriptional regulator [Clostridia bacterium]
MKIDQFLETATSLKSTELQVWQQVIRGVQTVCISPHWHEQMEILYIERGEMDLKVGEDSFHGTPGMAVIVNPRQIHSGVCTSQELIYDVIQLNLESMLSNSSISLQYIDPLLKEKVRFVTRLTDPEPVVAIRQWIRSLRSKQHPLNIIGQTYQTLSVLYRLCVAEQGIFHTPNHKFHQILEYIDAHYTEPLSARSISQLFNYNESYFCRHFKQLTGLTLSAYIRILRMEKAQRLLKQPDISIAQVAQQCGYTDANYFCLCVRKHFLLSPTELRQKMLNA